MKYTIEVKEVHTKNIEVEAKNPMLAMGKVMQSYNNGEIVMTKDDYMETLYNDVTKRVDKNAYFGN